MSAKWNRDVPHRFTASARLPDGKSRAMIVEARPDGTWRWTSFAKGQHGPFLRGTSPTVSQAIAAAEHGGAAFDSPATPHRPLRSAPQLLAFRCP